MGVERVWGLGFGNVFLQEGLSIRSMYTGGNQIGAKFWEAPSVENLHG